jgi:small-conductance mechanosensitive channel
MNFFGGQEDFWSRQFMGNTYLRLVASLGIIGGGSLLVYIIDRIILYRLQIWAKKTVTTIDDFVIDVVQKVGYPLMYFVVVFVAFKNLIFEENVHSVANKLALIIITVAVIKALTMLVDYLVTTYVSGKNADVTTAKSVRGLMILIKIIIWIIGIILMLDNMGYKVSTVVTGLGISGIAVALAAQAVLGDLFSYISILFDKPFQVGDTIMVDEHVGTVENIGIKTTRIRSLGGEEIIFSNSNLTGSRIRNLKRMEARRAVFSLGLTYDTKPDVLRAVPEIIRGIISPIKDARFDRAHFTSFGDSSLNFEVVYFITTPDYMRFMDIQQEINLKIAAELNLHIQQEPFW